MRSLGKLGVRVWAAHHHALSPPNSSRYCAGTVAVGFNGRPWPDEELTLSELLAAGRQLGRSTVLIAGSDEWSTFVAQHAAVLAEWFRFPLMPLELVEGLATKDGLYRLATRHDLPTPRMVFPTSRSQAIAEAAALQYPVMIKPIVSRPDVQVKAVVDNARELLDVYRRMEESPDAPNVMYQEYIPGDDSDVWIFNGYFDAESRCLAAATGVKIRQHPARMGIASLGEMRHNQTVIDATCEFLRKVGYRGIVDVGYRYDARDGQYKVLDINPRLGGAFRMFVDKTGMDVARALYLDLTGHGVPRIATFDGRRWINETADIIASTHYHRLDGLGLIGWLRSLRGVREGATWALNDPMPFILALAVLVRETLAGKSRRLLRRIHAAFNRTSPRSASGQGVA